MWRYIQIKKNRDILTLLLAIAVAAGGAYAYLRSSDKPTPPQSGITATGPGAIAAGRDASGNTVTTNGGTAPATQSPPAAK